MPLKTFWSYVLSLSKGKSDETHVNDETRKTLMKQHERKKVDTGIFAGESELEELEKKQLFPQRIHSGVFKSGGPGNTRGYSSSEGNFEEDSDDDDLDNDSDDDSESARYVLKQPCMALSNLRLKEHFDN